MSSGTPFRKRALSLEQTPESPERDAKKVRISTTPSTSRGDKKRRRKKKRTAPVVDDKLRRSLDTKPSSGGAKSPLLASADRPLNAEVDQPVASSSESVEGPLEVPVLGRSSPSAEVERLLSPAASASSSSKGKEKAATRTPSPKPQELDLEAQIVDLKKQLASQKTQLDTHSEIVSTLQQSLMCQICVDLMYKPYALAPCGHLVCYDCLVRWFKTPSANDVIGEVHNPIYKRKTCPHCRAIVRERPVEVFGIKEMVNALDNSGLATGLPPRDESATVTAANDPWQDIFRKQPARSTGNPLMFLDDENLPAPGLMNAQQGGAGFMGIFDEEDNVYRCEDCLHEIFDGACSECGRIYAGFGEPIDLDDFDEDDEDGMGYNILAEELMQLGMMFHDDSDEDDDDLGPLMIEDVEDDEDVGYESSFIDDDGAEGARGGDLGVIDLAGSEDEEDVAEASSPVRQPIRGTVHARRAVVVVSSDDEDDITEGSPPSRATGRRRTTRNVPAVEEDEGASRDNDRIRWDSDGDDSGPEDRFASPVDTDEEAGDGSISRPPMNLVHLMEDASDEDNDSGPSGGEEDLDGGSDED